MCVMRASSVVTSDSHSPTLKISSDSNRIKINHSVNQSINQSSREEEEEVTEEIFHATALMKSNTNGTS